MKKLNEASLSRIKKHLEEHDTGLITAFRYAENCGEGRVLTKRENLQRNKSLLAKLQSKRYGTTNVKGSYIENYGSADAKEVGENVFFVVDLQDKGNLFKDLKILGEQFEQDSILFIPKGGEKSFLYGTNDCPKAYPGKGKTVTQNKRIIGQTGKFFTRVQGRPFVFNESLETEEIPLPEGFFGRWGCHEIAKVPWKDLEV